MSPLTPSYDAFGSFYAGEPYAVSTEVLDVY
jgi:hypothetical protein